MVHYKSIDQSQFAEETDIKEQEKSSMIFYKIHSWKYREVISTIIPPFLISS